MMIFYDIFVNTCKLQCRFAMIEQIFDCRRVMHRIRIHIMLHLGGKLGGPARQTYEFVPSFDGNAASDESCSLCNAVLVLLH